MLMVVLFTYNIIKLTILIFLFLFTSSSSFAEYKGLKKLSKNNSFVDNEGNLYSVNKISDKNNTLL